MFNKTRVSPKHKARVNANMRLVEYKYEKTFVILNDRSLTCQKDGLSNSLNLTNQDFYVRLVDEKNKENNSVLAGRSFSLPRSFWLSSLSTACLAG